MELENRFAGWVKPVYRSIFNPPFSPVSATRVVDVNPSAAHFTFDPVDCPDTEVFVKEERLLEHCLWRFDFVVRA